MLSASDPGVQVIEPVRSRCLCIRVAAPSEQATVQLLKHVAVKESAALPDELALRVAQVSLHRCMCMYAHAGCTISM